MDRATKAPAVRRALAWAALVLCLVAETSDLLHFVFVEHTVCAEHGELVHRGEHAHGSATSQPADGTGYAPSDIEHHGHEHCVALSDGREQLTPEAAPRIALSRSTPALALSATVRVDAVSAIPLLLLAPKNSPPKGA